MPVRNHTNSGTLTLLACALLAAACTSTNGTGTTAATVSATTTTSTQPATTAPSPAPSFEATLYFPRAGDDDPRLPCSAVYAVDRVLQGESRAEAIMGALLEGPTDAERAAGFTPLVDGNAPTARILTGASSLTVDFPGLLDVAPTLSGSCAGGRFRNAMHESLEGLAVRVALTIGDAATFDDTVGVECSAPQPEPTAGSLLAYLHCEGDATGPPVAVARSAPDAADPESRLAAAIGYLAAGPTLDEWRGGLVSALQRAGANAVASVGLADGRAAIDFERSDGAVGNYGTSAGSVIYLDELVATVFQFPEVREVVFTLHGSCDAFAAQFEQTCRTYERRDGIEALWSADQRAAAGRMTHDLATLASFGPRPAGGPEERAAGEWLVGRLLELRSSVETEPVPLPSGEASRNIWTAFGAGPVHVLLGAHYDSVAVSPGIDDNGSGTAVLLELGRRLAQAVPSGVTVTIAFFGAEEVLPGFTRNDHHFGSRLRAERLATAGDLPDAMVSADMIGVGSQLYATTYLDGDPSLAELLAATGSSLGVDVRVISRGDISDHEAFARQGVPSVFMWRPDNPAWHTGSDDHADIHLLLQDLAILEALVAQL